MSERRLYLDDAPGEQRGVVTLDGRPERLLIARYDDVPIQQPKTRAVVRVRRIERALKSAFLDLGEGPDAVLSLNETDRTITEGAWLEVEITAAARGEKGAAAALVQGSEGPIRVIHAAPNLDVQLQTCAPGASVTRGSAAREAADVAEDVAQRIEHPLPSGGRLFIEPTQALTAVDVDLGGASGDSRKATVRANKEAILAAARLLRLKRLGGLVAIDLAGKGHDGATLSALAKEAFAPDGVGVSIGPISRFGVLELALPRSGQPLAERLLAADGRASVSVIALRLLRAIERAAEPGRIVVAICAPEVAQIAQQLAPELTDRIGSRFTITADASKDRTFTEVTAQ